MVFWREEILIQFFWKDCLNYKKGLYEILHFPISEIIQLHFSKI